MTDDQGYGDLACHGHPFLKTPNIDKLYAQSTRFTDYHVSPTCAPTRCSLMVGRNPFKVGVTYTILERERMAPELPTVAEVLKKSRLHHRHFRQVASRTGKLRDCSSPCLTLRARSIG